VRLDAAYRVELCVSGAVAVDVRVVDALLPVPRAELKSKLRASGLTAGVLVNFRTARLGDGLVVIRRARSIRRPPELSAPLFARVLPSPGAEPVPEAPRMP
jgi:hypothetical protein